MTKAEAALAYTIMVYLRYPRGRRDIQCHISYMGGPVVDKVLEALVVCGLVLVEMRRYGNGLWETYYWRNDGLYESSGAAS